ncbi:hypothetical protein ADK58_12010 [Streptomyces sp. XY152]|nr:hypothetical protein ADK58_12010 [Streptomyces sp. XY152]
MSGARCQPHGSAGAPPVNGGHASAARDSKAPAGATLTFPAGAFAAFLDGVKGYSTVTDFARFRG